jgi:TrmH family RNA methyltransferase
MLSKAALKYINSLQIKKYRHQHQAFLVEGAKSVIELLSSDYQIEKIYLTEDFLHKATQITTKNIAYEIVPEKELVKAGTFATNNAALAIARIKPATEFLLPTRTLTLALDDIRDPIWVPLSAWRIGTVLPILFVRLPVPIFLTLK